MYFEDASVVDEEILSWLVSFVLKCSDLWWVMSDTIIAAVCESQRKCEPKYDCECMESAKQSHSFELYKFRSKAETVCDC